MGESREVAGVSVGCSCVVDETCVRGSRKRTFMKTSMSPFLAQALTYVRSSSRDLSTFGVRSREGGGEISVNARNVGATRETRGGRGEDGMDDQEGRSG